MGVMTRLHPLTKVALVAIAGTGAVVGGWALAFPRSFYDDFPGLGRIWVAVDGPFNEHLVRDVGALNLALGFVAALALVTASVAVSRAAGGAALIYGVPHLAYHALNLDPFDTGDAVAMLGSLAMAVAAGVAALAAPARTPADVAPVTPGTSAAAGTT
ncbi:MAG TPA: hypothetical protein VFK43_05230 [Acidimicrobiales bacterium]|nr:hypothetical protein [Acidimicrobiales bacterium]